MEIKLKWNYITENSKNLLLWFESSTAEMSPASLLNRNTIYDRDVQSCAMEGREYAGFHSNQSLH